MHIIKQEFSRNVSAYYLSMLGVLAVCLGGHMHFDKLIDLGVAFATASLVAFQGKKTADKEDPSQPTE